MTRGKNQSVKVLRQKFDKIVFLPFFRQFLVNSFDAVKKLMKNDFFKVSTIQNWLPEPEQECIDRIKFSGGKSFTEK